jgi:serine/threonine protein kinase
VSSGETRARHQQISRLYQEALELAREARAAFLEQACGADAALRLEVESLLASNDAANSFMAESALEVAAGFLGESIPEGKMFGPYQIVSVLGAGGMGEVHRARDSRLGRTVAIKILPAYLSGDPELKRRFEREARAVAALNHPHICTLHDVGEQDGVPFLVMEYLEGETLAERLKKGPLGQEHALRYAIEIAGAVDKAHRHGVIHRDLKPSNIMLTKQGAKVLDFGLAKLAKNAATQAPAAAGDLTEKGMLLGTVQYMAPEQLEGKEADARTDVFALGAVIYEMVTGRRAFTGASQASLIGSILKDVPPGISSLVPAIPTVLDHIVARCLAKDPDARWQSARDIALELEWIAGAKSDAQPPPRRGVWNRIPVPAALLFALATLVLLLVLFRRSEPELRMIRASIAPPVGSSFRSVGFQAGPVEVSPDGRRLAFSASTPDGRTVLWVRSLDALAANPLPGTEGGAFPFWSPDSRLIAFFADGKLKKTEAAGGPVLTICEAPQGRGGTWSVEGTILFAPGGPVGLTRVSASGGTPVVVTEVEESAGTRTHRWPQFLPDGRHFLYLSRPRFGGRETDTHGIYLASLDVKEGRRVLQANSNVAFAQGHLIFLRDSTLMAQAFDARRLALAGEAFPIAERVDYDLATGRGAFSVSEAGLLAYHASPSSLGSQLTWFSRDGGRAGTLGETGNFFNLQLSPDGKRATVDLLDPVNGAPSIWLYDIARGVKTRFTFDSAAGLSSIWSPDGASIIYTSSRRGHSDLFRKDSNGAGSEEILLESAVDKEPVTASPDGRALIFQTLGADRRTRSDLWILPLVGDGKPYPFLRSESVVPQCQVSPGGRWLAYTSDESKRLEVYVAGFPGLAGKRQISTAGGSQPRWSRDEKEIFYLAPDNKLMAAEVRTAAGGLEIGSVLPLFQTRPGGQRYVYDVSPDSRRFLVITTVEDKSAAPMNLVINWKPDARR